MYFPPTVTKTLQFNKRQTVAEAIQAIIKREGSKIIGKGYESVDHSEYGLFVPVWEGLLLSGWLDSNKMLLEYDLRNSVNYALC